MPYCNLCTGVHCTDYMPQFRMYKDSVQFCTSFSPLMHLPVPPHIMMAYTVSGQH
jgi:hypothetical protein